MTAKVVGVELKRVRNQAGETQEQSAAAVGVSRANLAQWEIGKYLPSAQNARQLDDHFQAGEALVNLVEAARSPRVQGPTVIASANFLPAAGSLLNVFHHVGRSLVGHLVRDKKGNPIGWRHNLQTKRHHTALSTAYGVQAMLLVGEPYVDLGALGASLLAMGSPGRGWLGRAGSTRSETTATVLDALFRIGTSLPVDEALTLMERSLSPWSRTRPFLLSTVLQTVVRLRPDAPLTRGLVDDLLAARLDFDGTKLWPEKAEPNLVLPEASVVHTARAVVALRDVLRCQDDRDDIREAVEQATRWLIDRIHPDDGVLEELIRPRPDDHGTTRVAIRHFTSAWVVQAIARAPQVPIVRLNRALRTLWNRYDHELGLWAWGNGDLPIWMTLDAVTALRSAALAVAPPPVNPLGE